MGSTFGFSAGISPAFFLPDSSVFLSLPSHTTSASSFVFSLSLNQYAIYEAIAVPCAESPAMAS
jgi:hypothetical protein